MRQRGFSLVEVMVAIALMGISMAAMTAMFKYMNDQYSNVTSNMGLITMTNELMTSTLVTGDCDPIFTNLPFSFDYTQAISPTGLPVSLTFGGDVIVDGASLPSYGLDIQTLRYKMSPGAFYYTYFPPNASTYFGYIELEARKINQHASGGAGLRPRSLGVVAIRTNTTGNQVMGCVGISSAEFRCITSPTAPNIWNRNTNVCE